MNDQFFWYWVNERHAIYLRRGSGEHPPWTNDKILQEWKFTNVFRQLDRVTLAYTDRMKTADNVAWETFLFRLFNWPPTFDILRNHGLDKDWDKDFAYDVLSTVSGKLFTGAYITASLGSTTSKMQVYVDCLDEIHDRKAEIDSILTGSESLQQSWSYLKQFPLVGGFVAYELVSDFRWSYLKDATDIDTWANAGPGAIRGLNRIFRSSVKDYQRTDKVMEMRILWERQNSRRRDYVPHMEMRDIEHSLCEFDKYMRILNGEGRPRSKYKGSSGDLFGVKI